MTTRTAPSSSAETATNVPRTLAVESAVAVAVVGSVDSIRATACMVHPSANTAALR